MRMRTIVTGFVELPPRLIAHLRALQPASTVQLKVVCNKCVTGSIHQSILVFQAAISGRSGHYVPKESVEAKTVRHDQEIL